MMNLGHAWRPRTKVPTPLGFLCLPLSSMPGLALLQDQGSRIRSGALEPEVLITRLSSLKPTNSPC